MMLSFLTICLLAAFIATGESLSCESCWGHGHTCEGPLEDCPPDKDICGITQIRTSGVFQTETVGKACLHSGECNKPLGSMDFGVTQQVLSKTTCCMGKECDKVIPPLPPINTTPNGRTCLGCYSVNQSDCKGIVAECMGDNIYCTELRSTGSFENWTAPFVMKGCTNYNVCEDMEVGSSSGFFTLDHCVTSSGAPIGIPGSPLIFLQTVSGLLLHKILV